MEFSQVNDKLLKKFQVRTAARYAAGAKIFAKDTLDPNPTGTDKRKAKIRVSEMAASASFVRL